MGYMTDERRMIQETARAFAMKEVLPLANKLDPEKGDIPRELIQKLADMGYFGIVIPEQYGGLGPGVFEYCLFTQELARAWTRGAAVNCRLPAEALIGEEGRAFYYISAGLERARAHTAARAIGLARGALEDATAYAQERRQFGQAIGEFQNTRFRLARMATEIEAARQLMYFVCDEIDQKRRCDKEAAMVKFFASEMAEKVTSEALQVFGGAGYTTLHAVERYWRDARLTKIFEGTSEIQQRIISDHLLGKPRERGKAA